MSVKGGSGRSFKEYTVKKISDTDTNNRPILNENIYNSYEFDTSKIDITDPLGLNKKKMLDLDSVGLGSGGVFWFIVIIILLILRR